MLCIICLNWNYVMESIYSILSLHLNSQDYSYLHFFFVLFHFDLVNNWVTLLQWDWHSLKHNDYFRNLAFALPVLAYSIESRRLGDQTVWEKIYHESKASVAPGCHYMGPRKSNGEISGGTDDDKDVRVRL